mmetsp:Transcript_4144/g.8093  ORF Transcript_4144/g.8093 Transcript_4144/m.8093 type:complete len:261 (-) Transcript_4144:488-1270(-)
MDKLMMTEVAVAPRAPERRSRMFLAQNASIKAPRAKSHSPSPSASLDDIDAALEAHFTSQNGRNLPAGRPGSVATDPGVEKVLGAQDVARIRTMMRTTKSVSWGSTKMQTVLHEDDEYRQAPKRMSSSPDRKRTQPLATGRRRSSSARSSPARSPDCLAGGALRAHQTHAQPSGQTDAQHWGWQIARSGSEAFSVPESVDSSRSTDVFFEDGQSYGSSTTRSNTPLSSGSGRQLSRKALTIQMRRLAVQRTLEQGGVVAL